MKDGFGQTCSLCCDVLDRRSPCLSPKFGGARRDRTDDILLAKQALSQLSYGPTSFCKEYGGPG